MNLAPHLIPIRRTRPSQRASGSLVWHGELHSLLCDDLEGWDGGHGKEASEGGDIWLIHFLVQQKLT